MSFGNMMNGTGGIGQKVDSLSGRSQPELQKQYADSVDTGVPDVATLIALNMMRTDLKAKEAEVRLAMQPKEPGTVLEQRAAELKNMAVGQNTTDVATNVGGGIAKKLRDEQNMQRMAQGAQGAPQGAQMAPQGPQMAPQAPPRMAANGGIIMQGAPNMQRMAGGGIIGFASRGEVKAADMAQFADDFGPAPVSAVIPQAEINAYRAELPSHQQYISDEEIVRRIKNPVSLFPKGRGGPPTLDRAARAARAERGVQEISDTGPDADTAAGYRFDSMLATHRAGLPTLPANVNNFGSPPAVTTGSPPPPPPPPPTLSNQPMNTEPRVEVPETGIAGVNMSTTQEPATGGLTADDPRTRGLQNALATKQVAFDKGILAEKAGRVGGATRARDDAARFGNRGGVQEQYAAMLAQRQALAEKQAAGRADNSFLRRTAGMRPGPAFQSYGASAVRDMDETDRLARNALTRQEGIRTGGIAADEKIAGKALDVQRTTTASNAQLDAAVTRALQQSMTDQGVALNADQKRALASQIASMNSADKRALIESNKSIAKYNAKTREVIQNSVNAVTMASARLTAQANAEQNKNKAIADLVKKLADIQAKRPEQIADLAVANVVLTGDMDKKEKAAYLAKRIKDLDTQMKLAIKPLEIVLAQLKSGVTPKDKR